MELELSTVAHADRSKYLRVLKKNYREMIEQDMERLRQWRERKGEILFANLMMEQEGRHLQEQLRNTWELYRKVSEFKSFSEE